MDGGSTPPAGTIERSEIVPRAKHLLVLRGGVERQSDVTPTIGRRDREAVPRPSERKRARAAGDSTRRYVRKTQNTFFGVLCFGLSAVDKTPPLDYTYIIPFFLRLRGKIMG